MPGRSRCPPLKEGSPTEVVLPGLPPDTLSRYRLLTRRPDTMDWQPEAESTFHTQRKPGSAFPFTLQADPHLDYSTEPALYLRCLANASADKPDFHIDLGDTFMTDKHRANETAAAQYLAQRFYFGHIAASSSLFLVLGNHDAEAGRWLDGSPDNLAVWSNQQRKRFYPNPIPDALYRGNVTPDPQAGMLQNYNAREWGDALFIALNPSWFPNASAAARTTGPARSAATSTSGSPQRSPAAGHPCGLFFYTTSSEASEKTRAAVPRRHDFTSGADRIPTAPLFSRRNVPAGPCPSTNYRSKPRLPLFSTAMTTCT